ncbi:hypothetical protein PHYSODRAFT_471116 [Phytophthora sojae]|uniref:SWIM-type domain-containing protein n=1 Tax=Phytophthora sojae (strain P6497) TaxID=1094619 RepID=G4YPC2_PHYSP|nr:hypothetical protein PHYSODRAFT_471116 [Phytophthora sojae]EGZ27902.1 hypothetical protein PHYSODRAFT_471116 [Phytophthora sojae]|eukprot:XP_009515177.1 hypothetical protein PHYSODRAFT_471116 [Phytophthora sojae]
MARITHENGAYKLSMAGTHTMEDSEETLTGIDGIFQPEVDNILEGGAGPEGCLTILRNRYADRPEMLDRLPSRSMLKSRKQYISREDRADAISNYAELAMWAGPRECTTRDHSSAIFKARPADFLYELIVLKCFTYGDNDEEMGVVVTTRTLLRNVVGAVNGQSDHGVVAAADGTYKLHRGGWTLVDFGSYALHHARGAFQHKFIPCANMFVRSETTETYQALYATIRSAVQTFFNIDLQIAFGSLDHSDAITSAFTVDWPAAWENVVLPSLNWLHKARTTKQFIALAAVVTRQIRVDNEAPYEAWLPEEYLAERWRAWFVTCSGCPGIVPNQNPIEAYHKTIKTANVLSLRASTAYVLNQSLPRILSSASANSIVGLPITTFCTGPIPPEMVAAAAQLLSQSENHRVVFKPRAQRREKEAVVFNAKAYVVGNTNLNGVAVTQKRVQTFLKSLGGVLKPNAQVSTISIDYLSLHKVAVLETTPYQHNWESPNWSMEEIRAVRNRYRCDCKAHYSSGWICSHVLGALAILDNFDLGRMLKRLPARRPPGRPRKSPRALQKDGEAYFSAVRLQRELPKRPAMALNWQCSVEFKETVDGVVSYENYKGKVRSWSNRAGVYHWKVEFENGVIKQLKAQELAKALEYADSTGIAVAGP